VHHGDCTNAIKEADMPAFDDAAIRKVLDEFAAAYSARDVEAVLSLFSKDPRAVLVGTGADEIRIGPDQFREQTERDLSQAESIELHLGDVMVSGHGDVAWTFAEPVVTATVGGQQMRMPVRMTLVLVQEGGDWRIHSGHLSVAATEQASGESFANV
jgi:uncharacterized protein (TIGR02246 family)